MTSKIVDAGGRKCAMELAIIAAKENFCDVPYGIAVLCQCHNTNARATIENMGQDRICSYLEGKHSYVSDALKILDVLSGKF